MGDDRSLNAIEENENRSDILTKPLSPEKFHKILDRILDNDLLVCATVFFVHTDKHLHIDLLNTTGPKKTEARRLDLSYVYLDTCSTFHQNINTDTVTSTLCSGG